MLKQRQFKPQEVRKMSEKAMNKVEMGENKDGEINYRREKIKTGNTGAKLQRGASIMKLGGLQVKIR